MFAPSAKHDITARAITTMELDQHFDVLCQAFQLDRQLAYPIFKQDPFFDLLHKRALFHDRRMVSVLTLIPSGLRLHAPNPLSFSAVVGVGTPPTRRGRGYASTLIGETLRSIAREFHCPIAALECDRPDYYRRFGFERCSTVYEWDAPPSALPGHEGTAHVAQLTPDQAAVVSQQVHHLHAITEDRSPGAFQRDGRRWKAIETLTANRRLAVVLRDGKVDAYMAFHVDTSEPAGAIIVHEIVCQNNDDGKAMIGFLSQQYNVARIHAQMSGTQFRELGLEGLAGLNLGLTDGIMLRIVDLPAVIAAYSQSPHWSDSISELKSDLTIRVEDRAAQEQTVEVRISGSEIECDKTDDNCIAGDIGALTQMIVGYASASSLIELGRIRTSSPQCLEFAEALFPPTDIFLGFADRF